MQSHHDILYFCQNGNLAEVRNLLEQGVSVNFQNSEGETPLQVSAANGFSQIVSLLISYGALVDLPNSYGWTPLIHAARHGHFATISLLLKKKAKVNICNKLGLSPIVASAWSGNLKTVKLLVEAGAMVDHIASLNQNTECDLSPLMAAALCGYDDIVTYLLDEGANVDQVSPVTGLSPLMLAAYGGQKKIAQIVVENGSDITKTDICDRSAMDFAVNCSQQEIILFLESIMVSKYANEGSQGADIFIAVRSGDILKVKSILKQNPDSVNAISSHDGMTPLMLAAMLGYNSIINLLICNGAKLDAQDLENGWTALMYAIFHRRSQTVEFLLKKGASIDFRASNGFTALDLARHLDSFDANIIENLASKFLTTNLSTRKTSINSASDTLERKKVSGSERFFSKKSETQTGLKNWFGGVAQHFQQKMLTRLSPRHSDKLSTSDALGLDTTLVNEVFEETKSPNELTEAVKLHPLSPNKYLAKELKEHKIEAIKPPLPPLDYFNPITVSSRKHDKNIKPKRNSLQVPRLLKDYKKKNLLACSSSELEESGDPFQNLADKKIKENVGIKKTEISTVMETTSAASNILPSENESNAIESHTGELTALLHKESLQKYVEKFQEHEVDIDTLQYLTKEDLTDIGIESSGSQKILLDVINKLQKLD
ncbi:Ankyrin repeat and SAM domain-containing protein 6 [Araneus ventricosus]|uniref:Ankyrin repeat and SAM domain-containing protein 6 n=1 Tax=Araneus ventricosus TaxID=182803 RepID=A0A4Y2CDV4_ARAVE|nr:Ankyrin repeat and SAM domain-containing protein 6 [Araneus ventricosus]